MLEIVENYMMEILATVLTAVASFIGVAIKNKYTELVNTKEKKEVVENVVKFVEQTCCSKITSEEKKELAKDKALAWLNEKGISISETELDILIEASVSGLQQGLKNGKAK